MSLTPDKASANLGEQAPLIDTFCRACYVAVGGLAVLWLAAMVFADFGGRIAPEMASMR